MAQAGDTGSNTFDRMLRMFRQRPMMRAGCVACAALVLVAIFLGAFAGGSGGFALDCADEVAGVGSNANNAADNDLDKQESGLGAGLAADADDASGDGRADDGDTASERILVDVSGAVKEPAVVELEADARVHDAIAAAGGLAADADISSLNRAARVSDGQKVYVPREGETATVPQGGGTSDGSAQGGSQDGGAPSGLVNINTADEAELDGLPGVGPSTARAIIEDRERNGSFSSPEDLMRVSGIGEKKFEKLRSLICT